MYGYLNDIPEAEPKQKVWSSVCHKPYLLRKLLNYWARSRLGINITYIDVDKVYLSFRHSGLVSQKIIGFDLSNTLDKAFVMNCLKRVFRTARPEIINSDQGVHFTNQDYISLIEETDY